MPEQQIMSYLTGLAGLAVLWLIVRIATGKHPWALVIGEDGRPSTSKFQMIIWTAAVVFAFLAIFQIRFSSGYRQVLPDVPTNLLIAMGISVATAVSAKSIAVGAQSKADAAAATAANAGAPPPPPPASQSGIFAGDSVGLAQNAQGGPYEAYVSEQNLVADSENGPITHPTIDTIFERFAGDRYVVRSARRQ